MLRAVATAFIFLMLSVFVAAMVGAFSIVEAVSPPLLTLLFLGAWGVFGLSYAFLQRREGAE